MKVHYLQHVAFEDPGYIRTYLEENRDTLTGTLFFRPGYQLPAVKDIDALVIMGGPMNVYDDQQYAWLTPEKEFIRECIKANKRILGICLGAQLVAHCLGADVTRAPHPEIGWMPVMPAPALQFIPALHQLFENNPVVFHWHGDQFAIPAGANHLLVSEANTNQAFSYHEKVIGLQFHLEVTPQGIHEMLNYGSEELKPSAFVQDAGTIAAGSYQAAANHLLMAGLLQYWLRQEVLK